MWPRGDNLTAPWIVRRQHPAASAPSTVHVSSNYSVRRSHPGLEIDRRGRAATSRESGAKREVYWHASCPIREDGHVALRRGDPRRRLSCDDR